MKSTKTCVVIYIIITHIHYVISLGENCNFSDLLNLVTSRMNDSSNYIIPKDNSDLTKLRTPDIEDFGTYDFIIVGAGAGGSVIANRLSEIPEWKVLLLEAGDSDDDFFKIVGLYSYNIQSQFNWGYNTTKQKYGCLGTQDQMCAAAHGKVIGGSTSINEALYARGHPEDFNRWVEVYGNSGWSFDEILPYFKKSENAIFKPKDEYYHGVGGYLTTSIIKDTPRLTSTMIRAFEEIGYPYADSNGAHSENSIFRAQLTLKGNERVSASTAFLKPAAHRKNLEISLNSFVTKVIIDDVTKEASGVEFIKNGQKYIANIGKEIIISAGGYSSPQVLMLSGIGPKEHLKELNISVIADLPVGQQYKDHVVFFGITIKTNQTLYNYTTEENLHRYVEHLRPYTGLIEAMILDNLNQSDEKRPEIEFVVMAPASSGESMQGVFRFNEDYAAAYQVDTTTDAFASVILLHPKSAGSISLKSNDPKDKPLINPNILSDSEDVETLYQGIQKLLELNKSTALKEFGAELVVQDSPYCIDEKLSHEWWICAIRHWSVIGFHPSSSNSMGIDEKTSVVNSRLRVHGIRKLRVADESIMPESISGHNMAPTYMIGEHAADIIKEDHGKLIKLRF